MLLACIQQIPLSACILLDSGGPRTIQPYQMSLKQYCCSSKESKQCCMSSLCFAFYHLQTHLLYMTTAFHRAHSDGCCLRAVIDTIFAITWRVYNFDFIYYNCWDLHTYYWYNNYAIWHITARRHRRWFFTDTASRKYRSAHRCQQLKSPSMPSLKECHRRKPLLYRVMVGLIELVLG